MDKIYYSEEIDKDTKYRQEYIEGLENFLQKKKLEADGKRLAYISPEKYATEKEVYRNRLLDMLGFPLKETREVPCLLEKKFVATDKNVNIYRYQFSVLGDLKFYGIYFEQIEEPAEKPFILGLHGGDGTSELVSSIHQDSANYNHMVRRMTDRGANVFVPQLLLWKNELYGNEYDRIHIDGKLRQLGGSITALELYLMQRAIDYFVDQENINKNRIGAVGMSYGGMYAGHLAAIDTRVKVCYSCSWLNDSFVHSWTDWSYFNAQNTFTSAEIFAMISPRSLFVAMGNADELFDYKNTLKACEYIYDYYKYFDKSNNFRFVIFDGNHEFDKGDVGLEFLFEKI